MKFATSRAGKSRRHAVARWATLLPLYAAIVGGLHAQASSTVTPQEVTNQVRTTAPSTNEATARPRGYVGPLADLGKSMNDAGFYPNLFLGEWYVANPNSGVHPGNHQWMTQVNAGFDYYLEPLTGIPGTSIHFVESEVPWITSQTATHNYFTAAGDIINASASGYVPVKAHLTRFTIEQQFLDNKGFVEGGKGYMNDYVARPDCLSAFMCMSTIAITHKASGFNFPNYSNWFGRIGWNITPNLKVQGMWYQYDNNASLTNGWERDRPSNFPGYLVDLQYDLKKSSYPSAYELMYYHNKIPQTDQLCFTCAKTVSNNQSGIFASAMTTFWRPDLDKPSMVQGFVSLATAFNHEQTESPSVGGINYAVDAGLTWRAPFASRPFDSYSFQVTAVQLTRDEQTFLDNQGYGKPGRTEYSVGGSAMFKVYDFVYVGGYAEYLIHENAAFAANPVVNPSHSMPRDGFGIGLTVVIQASQLLGLTTRLTGYDGHYP